MSDDFLRQIHAVDLVPPPVLDALLSAATTERVATTEKLVRGYANQVYRATTVSGRTVLVRIPYDDRSFDAEASAMRFAREAGAPVPEILTIAPLATVRGPRQAMVLAAAAGHPLAAVEPRLTPTQLAEVYAQLGTALRAIHRVTLPAFGPADDAIATWDDLVDTWLAACRRAQPALHSAGFVDDEIGALLAQVASVRAAAPPAAVLCHGDLSSDHVFVDDELRLTAIIDWGQAIGAEPALDMAMLKLFHPHIEVAWVQRGYGPAGAFAAGFEHRMTAYMTAVAMHDVDFHGAQGDTETVTAAVAVLRQNLARGAAGTG